MNYEEEKMKADMFRSNMIISSGSGDYYANTTHPYWSDKPGNPYLPLDENGNKRKGFIG